MNEPAVPRTRKIPMKMGTPLSNECSDSSDPVRPVFESKSAPARASSATQRDTSEGDGVAVADDNASPREDIKIGNTGARWEEKLETAQSGSAERSTLTTQLMPTPEGPSSGSPEFPTPGKVAGVIPVAPLRPDDANPHESYAALKQLLRIAEQESANVHAAPASSAERPNACAPELPPATAEIPNGDTSAHPAETYVVPEADIETEGNSHGAQDWESKKCVGDLDGNERDDLWPRANPPIVEDENASTENQLERGWIQAVSLVPTLRMAP
jgi:hypothetical protein